RNLKLNDEEGISALPDTELFENLTLMGYNISPNQKFTFQKGEGSGTPTEPHHTPSPEAQPTSHTTHSSSTLPPATTTSIPTVTPSDTTPIRQYTRRARIAQSSALPTIADEPESPLRDISQGEAFPTDSGFIADQDRATIAKSSTLPHDSGPRVTSPAADEGSMQQTINELTALCTSLQRQYSELAVKFEAQEIEITSLKARVKLLEDRQGVAAEGSGDDAPIKGRNLDEGEAAAERASDDTEEMATVLTSMDAATVLARGAAEVPTGSGSIPTAGPLLLRFPLAVMWFPLPVQFLPLLLWSLHTEEEKAKKELEEQLEREDKRRSEQIARDAEIAKIHVEEELQIMIDGLDRNNKTVAKYLQEYHQFASELPIERRIELISDLVKGMTFKEVKAKFNSVWKQMKDFIPMGLKEEAERIKRKGLSLESKDESSDILKKFITEIENLKDYKVKIIRCDNGGEFRNKEMNDFFSQKGIKREFSNARIPQQNVDAGTNSTNLSGTKDAANQEVKKDKSSLRYIVLHNWAHDALLESTSDQDRATIAKSSTLPMIQHQGLLPLLLLRAEMATVLTSMDAAIVLASGAAEVPTGSGPIPTAGPFVAEVPTKSDVVPTASPVFATATVVTPYRRRKGKEVMVESDTPKKQKVQEQINAQVTKELEEQLERKDQRRGMTFEEVEAKFNSVWKQIEDFIPMGSKEEAERIKRKAKDKEIFMLVEKDYPLRKGLALVMISYKLQVDNYSRMENDQILKIYKITSTPRQQGD
nr:putative ribonuclease H-like domain-containing protein [Tanacetum cinerariifolium]